MFAHVIRAAIRTRLMILDISRFRQHISVRSSALHSPSFCDLRGVPEGAPYYFIGHYMTYSAVFVDAGYLFAQGSVALTGAKRNRSELRHQ